MPRSARLDAPGVLHHIMIRGIERRKIFWNDEDRVDFLDRLSSLLLETETSCYAWALLANHAHLLLRSGKVPLATVMRRLLRATPSGSIDDTSNEAANSSRIDISPSCAKRMFICGNWCDIYILIPFGLGSSRTSPTWMIMTIAGTALW